jgi:O-antigen/teichoic acid export membrane protein
MKSISNLFWNSMNGIVLAILSFIFTPVYSSLVGIENYGLINVWMISLVVASVFDFGINLTINNIISNNSIEKSEKNKGFVYLEKQITFRILIFFLVSGFLLSLLYFINFISYDYFVISIFIALSAYMQLAFQFYVNVYLGLQLHKKINSINIIINCSKYIIGFILLYFFNTLLYFFIFQAILSLFQFFFLRSLTRNHLGISKNYTLVKHDYSPNDELKRYTKNLTILSFASITLGHLDRIWALIVDDLEFYGYYAIAFTGASCLQLIIQPFYKTYFSKYSSYGKSNYDELLILFHSSSIICNGVLTIISVNLFIYSEFLLKLWLGDLYIDNILLNFLLIITGLTLSGYFWLPAAFMQSQKKPEFHNKMIIYSIFFSFLVLIIGKFFNLFDSPASVWIVHGLILFVFESIHLHNKYRGFKLIYWLLNGIFIPFTIALVISYSISLIESNSIILNIIKLILSLIIPIASFLYLSTKNKNIRNAF